MRTLLAICALIAISLVCGLPRSAPIPEPGKFIGYVPDQRAPASTVKWRVGDYIFTPLADFEIDARVLLRDRYWFDASADISPIDLTLGWGPMSDTAQIEKVDFWHGSRYYYYRILDASIPVATVARNSANMHMIPANDAVRKDLLAVRPNEFISITGKLVEVNTSAGFHWRSSLTREDTGMGSCEVIWVDAVYYVDP